MRRKALHIDPSKLLKSRYYCALLLPMLQEMRKRRLHSVNEYRPDDHKDRNQRSFHECTKPFRLVVGGNQSGKSLCSAMEIVWGLRGKHPYKELDPRPGARYYVLSASYRTIQEGIYRHLVERLPKWEIEEQGPLIAGYTMPGYIKMKNGNQVDFISGEGREDARRKIQAAAIRGMVVDEEVDDLLFREGLMRLVAQGGWMVISATLIRSEPWVLNLEQRAERGDPAVALFRFSSYRAAEVGHISKERLAEIESLYSEDDIEVRLKGQSRRRQGLVYPEIDGDHIVDPFDIPHDWTHYCAIDPGLRNFAALWIAVSPAGDAFAYRELKIAPKGWQVAAESIFAAEGYRYLAEAQRWVPVEGTTEDITARWMDPAGFRQSVNGDLGTAQLLAQAPYYLECAPAQNEVDVGIERVRSYLKKSYKEGKPCLRFFRTLTKTLEELSNYRWAPDDRGSKRNAVAERPIKRDDHLCDCLRYLAMGGLTYQRPMEPDPLSNAGLAATFGAQVLAEPAICDGLRKLIQEKRRGDRVPHPAGLGIEY